MNAGDTFFISGDVHLWVIISDPEQDPDNLLIVNFTTLRSLRHDPACVLDVGDHPFVRHPTWVNYRAARVTSVRVLRGLEASRHLQRSQPLSEDVLLRVRIGAEETSQLPYRYFAILDAQGLRGLGEDSEGGT